MQCKHCDYRLWMLRTRECPECGQPFAPSQFEFVPGSVRFACPHCDQSYYGTGRNGHLVPVEFDCVNCGRHVHMDEMVLFPTEGLTEDQTRPEKMPWLDRGKRGFVSSWFRMIGMAMVSPGRLMRVTPVHSSVLSAWWFAVFTQFVFTFTAAVPVLGLMLVAMFGGGTPRGFGFAGGIVASFVSLVLGALLLLLAWGAMAHVFLVLTGGTAHPMGRTYQALCYSSGANVLAAVPCLGMYLSVLGSPVWWIVSAILMLKEGQRVHGGRATVAVLTMPVFLLAGFVGLVIWVQAQITRTMALATRPTTAPAGVMFSQTQAKKTEHVLDMLLTYAEQHDGGFPAHAIQLAKGNYLSVDDLLVSDVAERKGVIPVGGITLQKFADGSVEQKDAAVQAAVRAFPRGVVAYRLGDFVFTYSGVRSDSAAEDLWLVIAVPDPQTSSGNPGQTVVAGKTDGVVVEFPEADLPIRLAEQNRLRARYGLTSLPLPEEVTHDRPATGPEAEKGIP